jgi:hypothetical protein
MSAGIFISFASEDQRVANTLCQALESRGFKCWISSRDILPGENFQIAIVRAIRKAKMMLLVFTANSNASDEMSKELALASQQKLMVVPLRVEDVAPNDAFAYEFATRQWIDFFADWETAINQLCVRIGNAMPPEPDEVPVAPPRFAPVEVPAEPAVQAPAVQAPVGEARAAPEPVAEASPAPVVKAPVVEPPKPAPVAAVPPPTPVKAPEPVSTPAPTVARAPEAAAPMAKAKPDVKPALEVKSAPEAKPAKVEKLQPRPPARVAKPADATGTPKSRVGLYAAVGVVILIVVGLGFAVPTLMSKKPAAAQASIATAKPHAPVPGAAPTAAGTVAPTTVAASQPATTLPTATDGTPQLDATGNPVADTSVAPVTPKPRKPKAKPVVHAAPKSDVPY